MDGVDLIDSLIFDKSFFAVSTSFSTNPTYIKFSDLQLNISRTPRKLEFFLLLANFAFASNRAVSKARANESC